VAYHAVCVCACYCRALGTVLLWSVDVASTILPENGVSNMSRWDVMQQLLDMAHQKCWQVLL
jgi:hypothetical protein